MNSNKSLPLLMVAILIIAIIGGTLAYWNWQSTNGQKTNVTFTVAQGFTCGADGGGDITNADVTLAPAACTNPEYAIQRTVTVSTTQDQGKEIVLDMWLKVNNIGSGLAGTHNFKYALTTNASSCTTDVITEGDFYGANTTDNSEFKLLEGKQYSQSTPQAGDVYYLYIWLDAVESSPATQSQTFNMTLEGSCTDELPQASAAEEKYVVATETMEIGASLSQGVIPRNTAAAAMADWIDIAGITKPFYLKQKFETVNVDKWCNVEISSGIQYDCFDTKPACESVLEANNLTEIAECKNIRQENIIAESYACFERNNNEHCLKGYDATAYLENAKTIYDAFGSDASLCNNLNPYSVDFNASSFECSISELNAYADDDGSVSTSDNATNFSYYCTIWSSGISRCNISKG